jgi:hypothetical protein
MFRRKPARVAARVKVRAFVEAIRQELLALQATANEVHNAVYITDATGGELDNWGGVLELLRESGELDVAYRARLLADIRAAFSAVITEADTTSAINDVGSTFEPALSCVGYDRHYESRWAWAKGGLLEPPAAVLPWSVFGRNAPARCPSTLGLFTVSLVLSRAPTAAEAIELGEAVFDVKPAQQRVLLVTRDEVNEAYILYREVYETP